MHCVSAFPDRLAEEIALDPRQNSEPGSCSRDLVRLIRRNPDIFTPDEAVEYLRLESERSLEFIRKEYDLVGTRIGKGFLYHRRHLDACINRMFGLQPATRTTPRQKL